MFTFFISWRQLFNFCSKNFCSALWQYSWTTVLIFSFLLHSVPWRTTLFRNNCLWVIWDRWLIFTDQETYGYKCIFLINVCKYWLKEVLKYIIKDLITYYNTNKRKNQNGWVGMKLHYITLYIHRYLISLVHFIIGWIAASLQPSWSMILRLNFLSKTCSQTECLTPT